MAALIKVYGERNTNTNYISKLIELNLYVKQVPGVVPPIIEKIRIILSGNELVNDVYYFLTYGKNLGWKHTCVKTQNELNKYKLVNDNLAFFTITKNPYSWLLSLHRRPHHYYYSDNPSFETFLKRRWKTVLRDNVGPELKSPIELWNIKNKSYLNLTGKNTLNITSEAIHEDSEGIIELISRKFNIERKSDSFIKYDRSTNDKGKDSNFYRQYYLQEKWRDDLTNKAIDIINETVDKKLMSHFGYKILS